MPALPPFLFRAALGAAALLPMSVTAAESAAAAPAKAAKADPVRDPLDLLRERLAQKLGASRAPDPANPNVVRVVSKASVEPAGIDRPGTTPNSAPEPRRAAARRGLGVGPVAHPGHPGHAAHWDYTGPGGPERWGLMKPEFAACAKGTRQSPIDLRDGLRVELDPVRFDYQPSHFRVVDTGHTVQVNLATGNAIEVMGRRYELVQFHFHRPSEERIDGKQFEMSVHLVHKDAQGRLAVVAVLLDRGAAQPLIQSVWNNLPLEKGDEVGAHTTLNPNDLLPPERPYFTYMGSLTTPPCSEGVLWMVMKQPVPVSAEQIGLFARLYPMNARPVQSASGRRIKESQ